MDDSGWWKAKHNETGKMGWLPKDFLVLLSESSSPSSPRSPRAAELPTPPLSNPPTNDPIQRTTSSINVKLVKSSENSFLSSSFDNTAVAKKDPAKTNRRFTVNSVGSRPDTAPTKAQDKDVILKQGYLVKVREKRYFQCV